MAREVEYEPVSVKPLLAEMKDTAELLIDLPCHTRRLLGRDKNVRDDRSPSYVNDNS